MAQPRYYTPRLDRDLIAPLYHTAKRRCVPMTRLASALVREGLARLEESTDAAVVREVTPAPDPHGRSK